MQTSQMRYGKILTTNRLGVICSRLEKQSHGRDRCFTADLQKRTGMIYTGRKAICVALDRLCAGNCLLDDRPKSIVESHG